MKRYSILFAAAFFFIFTVFSFSQEADSIVPEDVSSDISLEEPAAQDDVVEKAPEETVKEVKNISHPFLKRFDEGMHIFYKLGIALAIILGQILLIWLVWRLFKKLDEKIDRSGGDKIKPFTIKNLKLLTVKQIITVIHGFIKILKYLITVIQFFITVPIVFSLFPPTRDFAFALFGYIWTPIKNIAIDTIKYLPNLITIIIIIVVVRYVLKGIRFFADMIAKEKLVIPGFYSDWAYPTYKIFQVLLLAFTVAILYPYLPGSDSRAFQGVSVFVGVIFSLGSTTAIGNLVAGLVITYMRPFKIGDRVQIKEITGFVVEKTLMVVRLKTHKNEYVTFPNLLILGSNIINYNTSSDEDEEGLILYAEATFGYDTPWETVHEILIKAALATNYVQKTPKPFVLQTKLDDFYVCYQINCYTKEVSKVPAIYTMLYENIQNGFRAAGINMTSAHYEAILDKR